MEYLEHRRNRGLFLVSVLSLISVFDFFLFLFFSIRGLGEFFFIPLVGSSVVSQSRDVTRQYVREGISLRDELALASKFCKEGHTPHLYFNAIPELEIPFLCATMP